MEVPLPWERLLWSGRSRAVGGPRYALTDFRLVRIDGPRSSELALHDIKEIRSERSIIDKALGTVTLIVRAHNRRQPPFVLQRIKNGIQLRGMIEILAGDAPPLFDAEEVSAALRWKLRVSNGRTGRRLFASGAVMAAVFGVVIGVHGTPAPIIYPGDDAIYPGGLKADHDVIVRFMETMVMPWAKTTLGPLVGGPDCVTCSTCHSAQAEERHWAMPAVAALPKPDVLERGWERYSSSMDAQMRNAIYGYLAESDNQAYAAYMREHVMPGMAKLLRRPAYDFTQTYEYNRTHFAFGCYHCHRVK